MAIAPFDVSNVLTMAAALSMAGFVARSPEATLPQIPQQFNNGVDEVDYFGHLQHFWQNDNQDHLAAPLLQSATVPYDINDNFHESKFVSDFTPIDELQDLVSWQEAYRRGDMSFGGASNHAYPLVREQMQTIDEDQYNAMFMRDQHQDDGYGSGDVGSPDASDISSLLSLNLDDISSSTSPISNLLDLNDLGVDDLLNTDLGIEPAPPAEGTPNNQLQGAVGFSPSDSQHFDLEQLFGDDYLDLYNSFPRTDDDQADVARASVDTMDYASPLIDRHLDEYLGSFGGSDQPSNLDASFDDPFRMQFTEGSSDAERKLVTEVLSGYDYLDYAASADEDLDSPYQKELETNVVEDDVASMEGSEGASLSDFAGPSSANVFSPKTMSSLPDHDYAKEFKEEDEAATPPPPGDSATRNVVDALASNFYQDDMEEDTKFTVPSVPATTTRRTYAPPALRTATSSKRSKRDIVAPDIPYTQEELVGMDIDKFNRLISRYDDVRQIVLKDMRKKGKNKFAARNCRKRKMDVIDNLDNNVELLEKQKELLLHEQQLLLEETRQIHEKTVWLNDYILQQLHDELGNPYSDSHTLEYTTDGNVYLVPSMVKAEGKVAQNV